VSVSQFGYSISVTISTDASGRITNISTATPVPPSGQSSTIFSRAVPTLTSSALAAQSASISGVSGASATSNAWKGSLASAIAQIVVAPTPTPTPPAPQPTQPAVLPTGPAPTTSTSQSVAPAQSASALPTMPGCSTSAPVIVNDPEVTSPPFPQGQPSPYGLPLPSGVPIPISTIRSGDNNRTTTITQQQNYIQQYVQVWQQTVTKNSAKTQVVICTPTATPTVTVTETAYVTVTPTPLLSISPGAANLKKTFVCTKLLNGVTIKKTYKAVIVKCPLGYKLLKK
jgi:hypothetical protein